MKPTFEHTVNILVQAYLRGELAHKICSACAVGNIVAAALGTRPKKIDNPTVFDNNQFENGEFTEWFNSMHGSFYRNTKQIEATGYSITELKRIEMAFEAAPGQPPNENGDFDGIYPGLTTDPVWMFNGLMAVLDVLAEIHNVDLSEKESAKSLFIKDKLIV
jgi:hypothetical protein